MSRRANNDAAFSLFAFQDIITAVTGIMILVTLILALELLSKVKGSPAQQSKEVMEEIEATMTSVAELEATVARNRERIEDLKSRLAQGASEIGEVAGFDESAVQEDVTNMQQIDNQLANELEALADRIKKSTEQRDQMEDALESIDTEELKRMLDDIAQKQKDLEDLENRIIFNPSEGDNKTPWLVEITAEGITVAKTGVSAPPAKLAGINAFKTWAQQRDKNRDYFVLLVKPDGIALFDGLRESIRQLGFDVGFDLLASDKVAIDPEKGAAAQ